MGDSEAELDIDDADLETHTLAQHACRELKEVKGSLHEQKLLLQQIKGMLQRGGGSSSSASNGTAYTDKTEEAKVKTEVKKDGYELNVDPSADDFAPHLAAVCTRHNSTLIGAVKRALIQEVFTTGAYHLPYHRLLYTIFEALAPAAHKRKAASPPPRREKSGRQGGSPSGVSPSGVSSNGSPSGVGAPAPAAAAKHRQQAASQSGSQSASQSRKRA